MTGHRFSKRRYVGAVPNFRLAETLAPLDSARTSNNPFLAIYKLCFYSQLNARHMSYTTNYLQSESVAASGPEVIVLVNCMVQDAIKLGASDLHVEPWENAIEVRARVNGVLTEVAHLPLDLLDKISTRFKVMSNLVTYQAGMPQDGTAIGGPELDGVQLRVSIFPTTRGEKIVVRLFDPRDRRFDLSTLGFEDSTSQGLLRLLKRTSGLLLFTGPTGSGKTSTMYSALCYIMQRDGISMSISTVEDPVEFNLPMVSQTQIHPAQDFTYAVALKSILRQDPQVVMVGEIRDAETAAIAVQAGLTGHLRVLAQDAFQRHGIGEILRRMDLCLAHHRQIEFHRVFDRADAHADAVALHDVAQRRIHRAGFARPGRAGEQQQPARPLEHRAAALASVESSKPSVFRSKRRSRGSNSRTTIFSPRVVGKIETRNCTPSSSGPPIAVPSCGMPA